MKLATLISASCILGSGLKAVIGPRSQTRPGLEPRDGCLHAGAGDAAFSQLLSQRARQGWACGTEHR